MNVRASEFATPPPALVLTARLDSRAEGLFNDLRQAYFPPERNWLDAHLTLFHALPGDFERHIAEHLAACAAQVAPLPFVAPGPYSLGGGVAIAVECPALLALRETLRSTLCAQEGFVLTPQDRAKRRLHVTVQNKVSPQDAKRTLQGIAMAWNPGMGGEVTGLHLWRYRGGPWESAASFAFSGATGST